MPRKTDGILFELHPRPTNGEDGKPLLYARPVSGRKLSVDFFDDLCFQHRQMGKGEITRLFNTFLEVGSIYLAEGYRIETPLGSFAPKLKLLGDHTDPAMITSKDVIFSGIDFIPSKRLVEEVKNRHHGCRKGNGRVGNAQMHDSKAMEQALRKSMTKWGYTTISTFKTVSGLKYTTAKNYLNALCEGDEPLLERSREGRQWHYYFAKGK